MKGYLDLKELQRTAFICSRQAEALSILMPQNASKYREQLTQIIADLNADAERISKSPIHIIIS